MDVLHTKLAKDTGRPEEQMEEDRALLAEYEGNTKFVSKNTRRWKMNWQGFQLSDLV
jgi:hypothetical protein